MSTVFLFGAGASFGNPDCHPSPPPLGSGLFSELRRQGGIAATVSGDLRDLFESDFEKGMDAFWRRHNAETATFLREMARYFTRFAPGENNYYRKLVQAGRRARSRMVLGTTNYDLLIEAAIVDEGFNVEYSALPVENGFFSVLKIHGSCNFLPEPSVKLRGIKFAHFREAIMEGVPVRPVGPSEASEFCEREDSLAPAIAIYAEGKAVEFCPSYVARQLTEWQREVARAERIFLVGLRPNPGDWHIWRPRAQAKGWLSYVGLDGSEFETWRDQAKRKKAAVLAPTFEDALPFLIRYLERA